MTVKELSQLYFLNREIEMATRRLAELEAQATSISCNMSGMPGGGGGPSSKVELMAAEIIDLQAIIYAKKMQCIHEQQRLERFIAEVPDSLVRQIMALRFVNGLPWSQVAYSIGAGTSSDSVKKACYRYLRASEPKVVPNVPNVCDTLLP